MRENNKKIMIISVVFTLSIIWAAFAAIEWKNFIVATLPLLISIIVFIIWCIKLAKQRKTNEERRSLELPQIKYDYDKKKKTINVSKRGPGFNHIIRIDEHEVKNYTYVKPSYSFTSVTVGGVTTGGISKSGDYYKQDSNHKNYELVYCSSPYVEKGELIELIHLTDELVEKAKQTSISSYLDGNDIVVVKDIDVTDEVATLAQYGMMDDAMTYMNIKKAEGFPSLSKAKDILYWLTTNDVSTENNVSDSTQSLGGWT